MVGSTSVQTKLDRIYVDELIEKFYFNCGLVCDCGSCTLLFPVIKELPEEIGDLFRILLFGNKGNYCNMFYGGGWYSTMNDTLVIQFTPFVHIIGRILSNSSTMRILLTIIMIR